MVGTGGGEQAISLLNNGSENVNIKSIAISGPNASDFVISDNTCADSAYIIQASGDCSIGLSFTPSALGVRTASVTVVSDAVNSPFVMQVNGVGLGNSVNPLAVFPSTLSFAAPAGTPAGYQIVTLVNTGTQQIYVSSGVTGSADFSSSAPICTDNNYFTVSPGIFCQIYVYYTPSAVAASSATLAITSGAGTQSVSLRGAGQNPAKAIGAPGFNYLQCARNRGNEPSQGNTNSEHWNAAGRPDEFRHRRNERRRFQD